MKKFSLNLVALSAILIFIPSQSLANGAFIGIEGGMTHQFIKINNTPNPNLSIKDLFNKINSNYNITNVFFGIKSGYDFGKFRIYGQFNQNFQSKSDKRSVFGSKDEKLLGGGAAASTTKLDCDVFAKISSKEFLLGADYFVYFLENIKIFVGGFGGFEMQTIAYDYDVKDTLILNSHPNEPYLYNSNISQTNTAFMLGIKVGGIYTINTHNDIEFGMKMDKPFYSNINTTKFSAFVGYAYKF